MLSIVSRWKKFQSCQPYTFEPQPSIPLFGWFNFGQRLKLVPNTVHSLENTRSDSYKLHLSNLELFGGQILRSSSDSNHPCLSYKAVTKYWRVLEALKMRHALVQPPASSRETGMVEEMWGEDAKDTVAYVESDAKVKDLLHLLLAFLRPGAH